MKTATHNDIDSLPVLTRKELIVGLIDHFGKVPFDEEVNAPEKDCIYQLAIRGRTITDFVEQNETYRFFDVLNMDKTDEIFDFTIDKCDVKKCSFILDQIKDSKPRMSWGRFTHCNFEGVVFRNIDFHNVVFEHCNFRNVTFDNCTFGSGSFGFCRFYNATFNLCTMATTSIHYCAFLCSTFTSLHTLNRVYFSNVNFMNGKMGGCKFSNTNFYNVAFSRFNMYGDSNCCDLDPKVCLDVFSDCKFHQCYSWDANIMNVIIKGKKADISGLDIQKEDNNKHIYKLVYTDSNEEVKVNE